MADPDDYDNDGEARRRHRRLMAGGVTASLGVLVGLYVLVNFLEGLQPAEPPAIQWVSVVQPPLPPPPPPEELPPEEEIEELVLEELAPPVEPLPPEMAAEPPGQDLGLDAEGGAGADGFGLVGRKGGRGLIGGGGGTGTVTGWFTGVLQRDILAHLERYEALRKKKYSIMVRLWLAADGQVQRSELVSSTGDKDMDVLLENALNNGLKISAAPPKSKYKSVKIRVTTRI